MGKAGPVKTVLKRVVVALVVTVGTFIVGVLIGCWWTHRSPQSVEACGQWLQLVSAGIVFWALFGLVGQEIQTWGGSTCPEKVNIWVFRILNFFAMLVLFVSSSALISLKG